MAASREEEGQAMVSAELCKIKGDPQNQQSASDVLIFAMCSLWELMSFRSFQLLKYMSYSPASRLAWF